VKLFTLAVLILPLSLPASSVQYTINNGVRDLLSFVTDDFLTARPPQIDFNNHRYWELFAPQLTTSPCNVEQLIFLSCSVRVTEFEPKLIGFRADQRYDGGETQNVLAGLPLFSIPLDQFASLTLSNFQFSIIPTDLPPTVSPEPQTFLLLLLGLLVSCCVRLRLVETFRKQSARCK
jgi:hypothetical protein